jgi:peptidoglycan/LPS O-acetylase OafA/YrhL
MKSKKYRPDIDGMRAFAVFIVILFHYFPGFFPGGYLGVDIFFVISGYLITGVLSKKFNDINNFFIEFYCRRIRRIFPSLTVILIFVMVCGYVFLLPREYQTLSQHVIAGGTFLSNLALYLESGYFDITAILKPLQHLWSLGVEEQYYILYPFVLYICLKHKRSIYFTLSVCFVFSFGLNFIIPDSDYCFYSPITRFWEILSGALLCLFEQRKAISNHKIKIQDYGETISKESSMGSGTKRFTSRDTILSCLGMILILMSLTLGYFIGSRWYASIAIFPVVGTVLIIHAGNNSILNTHMISRPMFANIGLISYPLYLWHWPII